MTKKTCIAPFRNPLKIFKLLSFRQWIADSTYNVVFANFRNQMPELETEKIVRRTDLPIGNSIHTRVLVTPQVNAVYENPLLRKKAEAFAYKVFITAAAEEYNLLVHQDDVKKAEAVNYEGLFSGTEAASLPGFENSSTIGIQGLSNYARGVVRLQVRAAHQEAARIFRAINGPGTDEDKLFESLENYREGSQSQMRLLRDVYKIRYKEDLWDALQGDLNETELKRARSYISGANLEEADALAVIDMVFRFKDRELGKKITQFYRNRTKEEIESFEKVLNGKYLSALKEQFAIRLGSQPEISTVSIDNFYRRFLLKDSQVLVDAYRKDDPELINVAECYGALVSQPPKKYLFFGMLLERPDNIPGFVQRYQETLGKYGIETTLEIDVKAAFPDIVKRKGSQFYFNELLAGYPKIFVAEWLSSLSTDLSDLNNIKELFTLNQILKDFSQGATRSRTEFIKFVAPQTDQIGKESQQGLSATLFNAMLDVNGVEELVPELVPMVSQLTKDRKIRLKQDLISKNGGSINAVAKKIRDRFDPDVSATLISNILSIEGPEMSPYETNIGGPLSGFYRAFGVEAALHVQLKQGIQNLKSDSNSPFANRRKEAFEYLLGVYRDRHVTDLKDFSIDLGRDMGILLTAVPVGMSFVTTRGTATPAVATTMRAVARPLVSRLTSNLLGPIVFSAATIAERKLMEGDLYQFNKAEMTRELNHLLANMAVPNAGIIAEQAVNRIGTRLLIAKAQGMPVREARKMLNRHAKSPAFWDRQSQLQKSAVTGLLGGAAAGTINVAFGAAPEDVLLGMLQAGVASTLTTHVGQRIFEVKITPLEKPKPAKVTGNNKRRDNRKTGNEPAPESKGSGDANKKAPDENNKAAGGNEGGGETKPNDAPPPGDKVSPGEEAAPNQQVVGSDAETKTKKKKEPKPPKYERSVTQVSQVSKPVVARQEESPKDVRATPVAKEEPPKDVRATPDVKEEPPKKQEPVKGNGKTEPPVEVSSEVPREIQAAFNPKLAKLLAPIMFRGMETKGVTHMLKTLGFKPIAELEREIVYANKRQQIRVPIKPHLTSDEVGEIASKLELTFGEFNDATRGIAPKRFTRLRAD